jgi:hypothetical protein
VSINDPLVIEYLDNRKTFIVTRGRETFYDEDRCMREWDTMDEAEEWCLEEFGVKPRRPGGTFQLNLLEGG